MRAGINWKRGIDMYTPLYIKSFPDFRKRLKAGGEGATEDETVGWHHRLDGHEFEQVWGVGDGQGSLACCGPWGCKKSDGTM